MAILASLPGISVSILTDASPQPLTEYPCEDEDDPSIPAHLRRKTTTNYVQSLPNKFFSFKLDVGPPYMHDCPALAFIFIINGADDGPAQLCSPDNLDDGSCWECEVPGWEIKTDGRKKLFWFKFVVLRTNEENIWDMPDHELQALEKVGMVEVKVYRQDDSGIVQPKVQALTKSTTDAPEKINKGQAISHTVELVEGEALDDETIYQDEAFMDGKKHPIGVFRFKYRSKEDLQTCFVVPRSPSPAPPPLPSPPPPPGFEDLSDTYVNNLAKRGHAEKERLRRMQSQQRRGRAGRIEFVATDFESLSEDEKKKLAQDVFESNNGGPPIKIEPERPGPAADAVAGQKRGRGIIVTETRLENGKLVPEVQDDDEEDIQVTAQLKPTRIAAEEDNDVVFVRANPAPKRRAEMKNAARPRIKNEG